jgi:hypothetical protein
MKQGLTVIANDTRHRRHGGRISDENRDSRPTFNILPQTLSDEARLKRSEEKMPSFARRLSF